MDSSWQRRCLSHEGSCYGLMMRMSDVDPEQLPASKWWKYVYRSK